MQLKLNIQTLQNKKTRKQPPAVSSRYLFLMQRQKELCRISPMPNCTVSDTGVEASHCRVGSLAGRLLPGRSWRPGGWLGSSPPHKKGLPSSNGAVCDTGAHASCGRVRSLTGRLLLGNEAGLVGGQARVYHVVGNVQAQLHCAAALAGEVLLQCFAAVHKPKISPAAPHAHLPGQQQQPL